MGGSKQTTTSSSEPWSGAQPALSQAISGAQGLYNAGTGAQVYTGSTVTPWSKQSTNAMNTVENAANANLNGSGTSGQFQSIINNGGMTDAQKQAMDYTRGVAGSSFDINSDPAFRQVLDQTVNSVNMNAAGAGRYGSGTHQGVLAQQVGDLGARQYQNWQNRRDTANNSLFGMGQQAQGNLASAYQGLQTPTSDLFKVGQMNEDLSNRQLNDTLRIFNEQQNKPWENLARFNAIATGNGQLGGTTTQTQPGQNPFVAALGGGLGGLGLLGSFL